MNSLTQEQKARIFALYVNQPYQLCINIEGNSVVERLTGIEIDGIAPDVVNGRDLLLLKPLSEISNEDAKQLGKMVGLANCFIVNRDEEGLSICDDLYALRLNFKWGYLSMRKLGALYNRNMLLLHQFLFSKGYALPLFIDLNHPDNNKTAIELGLAVPQSIK